MTIEQARCVVEIATCGTLREAATNLYISPSAVSQTLASLESELNTKLFIRSKNGAALTPVGKLIYAQCVSLLDCENRIFHLAHSSFATLHETKTVRIGLCNCVGVTITMISELLQDFSLAAHYCALSDMEYLLSNRFLEFAVCTGTKETLLRHRQEFQCQVIGQSTICVAMRKEHPLVAELKDSITPEQLGKERLMIVCPDIEPLLVNCIPNFHMSKMRFNVNVPEFAIDILRKFDMVATMPRLYIPGDMKVYSLDVSSHTSLDMYTYILTKPESLTDSHMEPADAERVASCIATLTDIIRSRQLPFVK